MAADAESETHSIIAAIKAGAFRQDKQPRAAAHGRAWPGLEKAIATALGSSTMASIEQDRQAHAAELEAEVRRKHEEMVRMSAERQAALDVAAEARRNDIAALPADGIVFLDTPFFIWAEPDYRIEPQAAPNNSTAKFKFHEFRSGNEEVSFWFQWVNDGDTFAVLDVFGELTFNGSASVWATGGHLDGSISFVTFTANLEPLRWWQQPPTEPQPFQPSQFNPMGSAFASAHWYQSHATASTPLFGSRGCSFQSFVVPPHATAVFKMVLELSYSVDDGTVDADFQSGAFALTCPGILLRRTG
jgi:hypothetical protein